MRSRISEHVSDSLRTIDALSMHQTFNVGITDLPTGRCASAMSPLVTRVPRKVQSDLAASRTACPELKRASKGLATRRARFPLSLRTFETAAPRSRHDDSPACRFGLCSRVFAFVRAVAAERAVHARPRRDHEFAAD